jgi:hypothetical protein
VRECRVCGCSDGTPCIDALGAACAWVAPDLCSACVGASPDQLVELFSEGEANDFLRFIRAGGGA